MRYIFFILLIAACVDKREVIKQTVTNWKLPAICSTRVTTSKTLHIPVFEFVNGDYVISKMNVYEATPEAIKEEMVSLQDMTICL